MAESESTESKVAEASTKSSKQIQGGNPLHPQRYTESFVYIVYIYIYIHTVMYLLSSKVGLFFLCGALKKRVFVGD